MPATYFYNMVRYLDTNWIQRRDDVLNLPSLLDFSFARAVQVPPLATLKKSRILVKSSVPGFLILVVIKKEIKHIFDLESKRKGTFFSEKCSP